MSIKNRCVIVLAALSFLFGTGTSAPAVDSASSFQCLGGIVVIGSSEDQVKRMCGEPTKIERRGEESLLTWIYNSGATDFVYYVSFFSVKYTVFKWATMAIKPQRCNIGVKYGT